MNRLLFPTTKHWAFLDHAAVAPLPQPAADAMMEFAQDMAINGIQSYPRWSKRINEVRSLASELIHAHEPTEIAFVPSTTMGIGLIAEGFPWKAGDNLITAAEEYPSNQYPWMNLADRGVEVRRVESRGNRILVDDLRAAINGRTRLLTLSAVEFASGFRNSLETIGELCEEHNLFFFVDAIQALGAIPLNVQELPIHALSADGHKWLLGPEGAGIFWIDPEWLDRIHPIGVGSNSVVNAHEFSIIDFRLKPHSGRWEGGTYNGAGITALGASLELLLQEGIGNVWKQIQHLTNYLCEQAPRYGLEVFSSRLATDTSGIVSLIKPNQSHLELKKRCKEAGIVINVRSDRLRVSPHYYNTIEELDRFLECVR